MRKKVQNNVLKNIISIIFFMFLLFINQNVYAKSYTIDNMDIKATILESGSINVKQAITYNFEGSYNGIYITIPYELNDKEWNKANNKKDNDDQYDIYTGTKVLINNISDSYGNIYIKSDYAVNGQNLKYTVESNSQKYTIKVYSPSFYTKKTFILDYNIENICVNHLDVGELYYNFIGRRMGCSNKKFKYRHFITQQ